MNIQWPKFLVKASTTLVALTLSSQAFALFNGQVLVGKRWYDFQVDGASKMGVSATSIDAAGHIDPIPLVPVGFGLYMASISPNKDDLRATSASFMQMGLEIEAWIPLIPLVTPFAHLRYPFTGNLAVQSNVANGSGGTMGQDVTYKMKGVTIEVGGKFSLFPLAKVLVLLGRGMDTFESSENKVNGVMQTTKISGKAPSTSLMVGIELGI